MKDITTHPDISIRKAMKMLSQSGEKCLVIIDEDKLLLGTLSDGDVRKAILNGSSVSDSVINIYQQKPRVVVEGSYRLKEIKKIFTENKFDLIPVVNKDGHLTDIILWESVFSVSEKNKKKTIDAPVIIMAGGKGTRLEPFTKVLPKPLVPIHDKPIIEHIIERFLEVGIKDFYMTLNYKSKIIKAYFQESNPDFVIDFLEEHNPLGTAGSLRLLDGKINSPFFVTNCDIIIKTNYNSLFDFHQKGGYDVTLVASAKEYVIPYGTCEINKKGYLSRIDEKPQYDFLINTGLYILNPDILKLIPENKFYHITNLIDNAISKGKKIGVFPIDEDAWVDIGQWAEYQRAIEVL